MTALTTQPNWHQHAGLDHWLKHSIIPILLVMLLLLLPRPWSVVNEFTADPLIIELTQPEPVQEQTVAIEEQPIPEPIEPKPVEPAPIQPEPLPAPEAAPQPTQPQPVTSQAPQTASNSIDTETTTVQEEQKPSAVTLMNQINNRTSVEITEEFMPRTGPAKSYFVAQPEVTDWYADIPYLDESVDRPQVEMRFYAEGLEGSIERFFDKITVSKTFTTKYGTKIHCAWVGILAACSWK